ncbi:polycomb group RING finger protein 5 isoform X5 [Manis pentadactyla]|uniref:polycomb group RING finger protein 5 isoform X5 n=1 Tax=Manis pentadactyla TaxID=143292 RepID=UPI00255CE374|nr:polycomb group RING finger protein 5 isoform X5 [Manis pentadactyla]
MICSLQTQKFQISPCQGRVTTGGRLRALGQRGAPPAAAATGPLQARALPRAVPGRALRELRGGCLRRPGGRRREAVPQFVSNQGVRAVPRAGQQCVNKPTATPPPPRRARPAPAAAAAAGSALLTPATRRAGPAPSPRAARTPAAPPRPRRRGLLTYRPTRALAHHAPRAARPDRGLSRARNKRMNRMIPAIKEVNSRTWRKTGLLKENGEIWESRTTKRSDDQRSHDKSGY